jgi:hypothetical protein
MLRVEELASRPLMIQPRRGRLIQRPIEHVDSVSADRASRPPALEALRADGGLWWPKSSFHTPGRSLSHETATSVPLRARDEALALAEMRQSFYEASHQDGARKDLLETDRRRKERLRESAQIQESWAAAEAAAATTRRRRTPMNDRLIMHAVVRDEAQMRMDHVRQPFDDDYDQRGDVNGESSQLQRRSVRLELEREWRSTSSVAVDNARRRQAFVAGGGAVDVREEDGEAIKQPVSGLSDAMTILDARVNHMRGQLLAQKESNRQLRRELEERDAVEAALREENATLHRALAAFAEISRTEINRRGAHRPDSPMLRAVRGNSAADRFSIDRDDDDGLGAQARMSKLLANAWTEVAGGGGGGAGGRGGRDTNFRGDAFAQICPERDVPSANWTLDSAELDVRHASRVLRDGRPQRNGAYAATVHRPFERFDMDH